MFANQFICFQKWQNVQRCLIFLLMVSLLIKCALLFSGEVINLSGVRYVEAARQYAEGNFRAGLRIEKLPFYPMLIVAVRLVVGNWELSAKLISLFSMVGALIPLFLLTKDLFDEKAAFWAGLAFALSPILNEYAVEVIRDPIFLFFVAWATYFFCRALSSDRNRFFILASIASVLATLCRIEGVLLLGVFGLILLVLGIKHPAEGSRWFSRWFQGTALVVGVPLMVGVGLGVGLMLIPGIELGTFSRLGEPLDYLKDVLNGNFLNMYHHIDAQFKAYKNPWYVWTYGSFADTARHYLPLIYLISVVEIVVKNLFPIFVLPLLAGFRNRPTLHRGHWLILLLAGSYFLLGYYFLFTHDFIAKRYVLVPALLLYPWVGLGLGRMWGWITGRLKSRFAIILFLLIFGVIPAFKSMGDFTRAGKGDVLRQAGQWLSRQPQLLGAVVACSDPRVRFYSTESLEFIRQMEDAHVARDFGKMERVAIKNEADFLVVEVSNKKRKHKLDFKEFFLLKEFSGNVNDVLIYGRKIEPSQVSGKIEKLDMWH